MNGRRWLARFTSVLLLLGLSTLLVPVSGSCNDWNVFHSDAWQFEISYPTAYAVNHVEEASSHESGKFRVSFGTSLVPMLTVEVLSNPEHLEADEFAYQTIRPHDRREVGVESITVAGVEAVRATWFAEAGEGCATSEAYIPRGSYVFRVLSYCASDGLPHALSSFRFLKDE